MDEFASLDNELLPDTQADDLPIEEQTECTNDYFSNAYGQQYCVGDTIETADGPMTVTSIWEGQAVTDVYGGDLDADELYGEMGVAMGMSEEQFASFIDSYNELKREAAALETSHHVLGPTEMEIGRLGIRVRQANPDWTDEQVQAEVDRLLDPKIQTAEQYADLAKREAELFGEYGMQSQNHATFGQGIWVDADGKYFKFTGSNGNWQQTSQDDGLLDYGVPALIAIAGSFIAGPGLGGALGTGALGTAVGGAVNAALGSAITQAAMTGSIDPRSLVQAAIIGAIGGLADAAIDGQLPPEMDNAIWDLSGTLGMSPEEVINVLEGLATGAVTGDDLDDMVVGALGSWGETQIMDFLQGTFGDTVQVDDWFKDGASNIPIEALEPIIGGVIEGITNGTLDDPAMWGKAIWDYFQTGGDIDFMLPDGVSLGDWFGGSFGGLGECEDWMPDWVCNFDVDIPNPCEDWEMLEGICDAKIQCVNQNGEWDSNLRECLPSIGGGGDFNIGDPCEDEQGNPGFLTDTPLGVICNVEIGDLPELGDPCTTESGQEGTLIGGALEGTFICEGIDVGELPKLGDPCTTDTGEEGTLIGGVLEGTFVCEGIDFSSPCGVDENGNEGWLNELGVCEWPEIENPCGVDENGNEGWLNELGVCEWPEIENPCGVDENGNEGWLNELGVCEWPEIENPCGVDENGNEGWLNELGVCEWPDIENPCGVDENGNEGWLNELGVCEWPDSTCPEGFRNENGECLPIDIPNPCEEGQFLDEAGVCQWPDIPTPDFRGGSPSNFNASWSGLFDYTPVDVYKGKGLEPYVDMIAKTKGMFDELS